MTLTIVVDGGDWVIAEEDYDTNYADADPDGDGPFEADPGHWWDFHDGCEEGEGYFDSGTETGRTYCGCGFWYDRYYWGL
jgi:hypothetical protein